MTVLFYSVIEAVTLRLSYLFEKKYSKRKWNILIGMIWLLLFVVVAFRDVTVGRDYETYIEAMVRVAQGREVYYDYTWLSFGFRCFIKIIALTGLPAIGVAYLASAIISGATIYFFLKAIIELSNRPTMSLFILFCFCYIFQCMNQFRQMFAVAVVLYSYKYIDKSFAKYCGLIVLAGLVHSSALIMIPMYFLTKMDLNRKIIAVYFFSGVAIAFLWTYIRQLILYTPYAYYVGWEYYDTSLGKSAILNLLVRLVMLAICLLFRKKVIIKDPRNARLYHFAAICTIFQVIAMYITMFSRVSTYFYVFYVLLLPEVFDSIKSKFSKGSKRIVTLAIVLVLVLYQIVYYKSQSAESAYDVYKFFFM